MYKDSVASENYILFAEELIMMHSALAHNKDGGVTAQSYHETLQDKEQAS
jgi:hypothetical protein